MTQERDPALVERLIELAKNVRDSGAYRSARFAEEARSILAELFPPADPDVLEAREIYIRANALGGEDAVFTRSGQMDDTQDVRMALAAIKRGRELARQEGGR